MTTLSLGCLHGYGILLRIEQVSRDTLQIQHGSLYPAFCRQDHQGFIASGWGEAENKRKVKYYRLTNAGRRQLRDEGAYWRRRSGAIALVRGAGPDDV